MSDTNMETTPETAAVKDDSSWLGLALNGAITLVTVIAVLMAYHYLVAVPSKQKIAVVDIADVLSLKQLEVTVAASKPGMTDAQRGESFEMIGKFAKEMETAIAEMQQECGCLLLVKAAVVKASSSEDMTPVLKQRLGMDNLNQAEMVKQLQSQGGSGQPPLLDDKPKGTGQ